MKWISTANYSVNERICRVNFNLYTCSERVLPKVQIETFLFKAIFRITFISSTRFQNLKVFVWCFRLQKYETFSLVNWEWKSKLFRLAAVASTWMNRLLCFIERVYANFKQQTTNCHCKVSIISKRILRINKF